MVQAPLFDGMSYCRPGKPRVVCGLDFGTVAGYAVLRIDAHGGLTPLVSGQCNLTGEHGRRFDAFDVLLTELALEHRPTAYAHESVSFTQGEHWRALYYGQLAMLERHAWAHDAVLVSVSTSEVKIRATGRGDASKGSVMAAVQGILGRSVRGDHEADAFGVALHAGDMLA